MSTVFLSGYFTGYTLQAQYDTLIVATGGTIGAGGVASGISNNYTVINGGRIGTAGGNTGVLIYRGGTVINDLGASITGGITGVNLGSGYQGRGTHTSFGSVVNNGSIAGGTGDGIYLGDNLLQGAFVTNGGTGNTGALISGANGIDDVAGVFATIDAAIDNFGTIQGTGGVGFAGIKMGDGTPGTIVNGSSLDTVALISGYIGVDGTADGPMVLQNFGTIEGTGSIAVLLGSSADTLIDEAHAVFIGTVDGAGGTLKLAGDAGAGTLTGIGTSFTNFSNVSINSDATWTLTGANAIASGATLTDDGTLTDAGTISGGIGLGAASARLSIAGGGYLSNNGTGSAVYSRYAVSVVNQGTIEVEAPGASLPGYYGIELANGGSIDNGGTITGNNFAGLRVLGGVSVTNSGLIASGRAGVFADFGVSIDNIGKIHGPINGVFARNGAATITNSGTIYGNNAIWVLNGTGTVTNSGTLQGLSDRAVSLTAGGTVANQAGGLITAPDNNVGVYLGGANYTATAPGVVTNAGTITGGAGILFYAGDTLSQTVIDSGTIIGSGGTAIAFGAGNDTLRLQPSTSAFIQGTVNGGGGSNLLEFASGATTGTLTGLGADFVGFSNGTVDAGASWVLSGSDTLASSTTVANAGSLTVAGALVNEGSLLTPGQALQIATGGSLINAGSIAGNPGSGAAVSVAAGGSVTNQASGVITGYTGITVAGTAVLTNAGTISGNTSHGSGIRLQASASVTNQSGGTISGFYGVYAASGSATVANAGSIAGAALGGIGVELRDGGVIVNGASGSTAASILGVQYGIAVNGPTTLTNFGTIVASDGGSGFYQGSGVATVFNAGVIGATNGSGMGIDLEGGGTIIDSGTVEGGNTAIRFGGTGSNLLVLENGYEFFGLIQGSASASNTLELVGNVDAPVTEKYLDQGVGLVNFQTVEFGPGAGNYATLGIRNDAELPATIAGFVGVHDTIDLTALSDTGNNAITSFNSPTDVLTVTGDNGSVQLHLDNNESYAGIDWVAQNDGNGGTAIQVVVPPVISGSVADQTTTDEATLSPFADVSISDVDVSQTETVTIALSNPANGTLSNLGGGSFDSSTGVYIVTGSDAAVTAALDGLVFTPTVHQAVPGSSVTTTFTIQATDTAGGTSTNNTTTVSATAVNDPPVITGASAGQTTTDEATVTPFSGVAIGDVDAGQTETVTVTLSNPGNGLLSNLGGGNYNAATGVYTVTGTDAQVTAALDGLAFAPTAHQAVPGSSVTTTFTIQATDTAGGTSTNNTTTVSATAVNDPPVITLPPGNTGVPNQTPYSPFTGLTVNDPDVGHVDTVTVTLSNPNGGVLSNLDGGSFDATTGVYSVTGTAADVTAALQGLVFTPTPPASDYVSTTSFTVAVTGPGGTATGSSVSVTSAQQVLGLSGAPDQQDVVSVSPDGSSFVAATPGKNNEAVVSDPSANASYTLPTGYQAEFLGGSAGALLTDPSGGNALLVGNSGNDTITAGAANDTILGGSGNNTLSVGGANDLILATGGFSVIDVTGLNAGVLGGGGTISAAVSGNNATLSASLSTASVTISGSHAAILGGTATNAGAFNVIDNGTNTTIAAFAANASIATYGSDALIFGGTGTSNVTLSGASDTLAGGAGNETVSATGNALDFAGTGALNFVAGAGTATIVGNSGGPEQITAGSGGVLFAAQMNTAATITAGNGASTVFGGSGSVVTYVGSLAGATFVASQGNETLTAAASSTANFFSGGAYADSNVLMVGGSGADTMLAGLGSDTMTGGAGNNAFAFFAANTGGAHDIITDFNANDSVYLIGYSPAQTAITVQDAATVGASGVTLTLSDNTQITFTDLSNVQALDGKILYVGGTG